MKPVSVLICLAVACVPMLHARAQPSTSTDIPVTLSAEDQGRMGIEVSVLAARQIADTADALIRVLDPIPLAMLDADLEAAAAAANVSRQELDRVSGLAGNSQGASQRALEAAVAQAASDRAALRLLERRLRLEWGSGIAALSGDARSALIADLTDSRAALVRGDAPARPGGVEGRLLIQLTPDAAPIEAATLGPTATADPRLQTVGIIAIVRGPGAQGLKPGLVVPGRIETEQRATGVVLPRAALVRLDGSVWVYVRTGDESFARREVIDARPLEDGWFVTRGFSPGTAIVEFGAGSLVAVERGDEAAEQD